MAATSFQQVTAMLVELNPQIFKKEVFCISSKGFNQRDAYRVMLRKYPDVMNIEQMRDALRISTKTGYKRRAEAMMRELQDDFEPPVDPNGPPGKAMLFADYLVQWLEIAKSTVKLTTYASYAVMPA